MRLRYLSLPDFPPLCDVNFTFGHEPLLGRALAIRFVVGINGTGKTRLLQALTETFLCLEQRRLPPFPINLAYDLGVGSERRTIYLHRPSENDASETELIEYDDSLPNNTRWDTPPEASRRNRFPGNALPGTGAMEVFLPTPLLVYTSGSTKAWWALFAPHMQDIELTLAGINEDQDRPLGWNAEQERTAYLLEALRLSKEISEEAQKDRLVKEQIEQAGEIKISTPDELRAVFKSSSAALFITTAQLKLTFCAVALHQTIQERTAPNDHANSGLRELLDEVHWEALLSITMDLDFRLDKVTKPQASLLHELISHATAVQREPEPGTGCRLVFDLRQPVPDEEVTVAKKLFTDLVSHFPVLPGSETDEEVRENPTPFEVFRTLYSWQQDGLLRDLTLVVRKSGIRDVLLYDWLSDGERMFLGRIALFHLLRREDNALLILDEPETHFNDIWKRRVVDILDDALGDLSSDVLISTHSSIALTDVFEQEITVLRQIPGSHKIQAASPDKPTFSASPNEIMRDIFDAHDTIGQRASEYLKLVLLIAARPEEVEMLWTKTTTEAEMRGHDDFNRLVDFIYEETQYMPVDYGEKTQIQRLLAETLKSLKTFTQQQETGEMSILQTLLALEERLGTSHYEFEFSRRIRLLEAQKSHASQN